MKKVLCLIDTLGMGGAERQMIGLALFLKQRGYKVDLVTYLHHDFYSELVHKYGIGTLTLHAGNSPISKLIAVFRHIRQSGGYDCVIGYKTGPCVIGCLLRLMGIRFRLIVSERNTTQVISFKEKIKFQLYRKADYVVPNSFSQAKFIMEHFSWLKNKTIAITNFTDTSYFTTKDTRSSGILNVLTTARVASQKNVLRYLDAVALLHRRGMTNVHFDWFGDVQTGEESYGEAVFKKLESLHLHDIITFHPAIPQILEKYQNCDIFCLPSNFEGFPNVICEAMSCGKPIVCSRVCDNPYIVREGENAIMFDNNSVEDMADKIQQICSMSQEKLLQWGKCSREIAVDLFSTDVFVDNYIKLIER